MPPEKKKEVSTRKEQENKLADKREGTTLI